MAFKPVADSGGGEIIKFDRPNTQVTGIYLGKQDFPTGKFGPTTKHMFKTETGIKVAFFKDNSQPGNLLSNATPGQLVRLTFTGTKPSKGGGNPMKLYALEIDEDFVASADDVAVETADEYDNEDDTPADEVVTAPVTRAPTTVNKSAVNSVLKQRRA